MHDMAATIDNKGLLVAIDALSDGLAFFDADECLLFCNQSFRAMNPGLDSFLVPGMPWSIYTREARERGIGAGLNQIEMHLASQADTPLEVEVSHPGKRWYRLGLQPVDDGGFVLKKSDVTEAFQAAELRDEADARLRHVLDACAVNIAMSRVKDGKILYRNPAWSARFGARSHTRETYADLSRRSDFVADILATRRVDNFEVQLLRADGTPFPAMIQARLVDYDGEDVVVASATDLTQLHAQRDELARRREASFQNEKLTSMGELLAGVAHELNNPLSVVVGQSLMLQEEQTSPEVSQRITQINAAAERCAKIVKTFLTMARQKPARLSPINVGDLVETAYVAATGALPAGAADAFRFEQDADLPPMLADEDQITQVVVNLLINAYQACAEGEGSPQITVSTRRAPNGDTKRDDIIICVADNGPGIPEADLGRIFEPFFTTKKKGAGVGLALSNRIIVAHNGRLRAVNGQNGGAVFSITLPVAETETIDSGESPRALRALIVDNDRPAATMLAELLHSQGAETTIAPSSPVALARIAASPAFDVILADMSVPGTDGAEFLRNLRIDHPGVVPKTILVATRKSDLPASDRPVLGKPATPPELRRALAAIVGAR